MLRQSIPIFEAMFPFFFFLQSICKDDCSIYPCFFGFIFLSFAKYYHEGLRITYFITLLTQIILFFTQTFYISLPLIALNLATILYFPIYKYPDPTGSYKVGYRTLVLPGITSVGIYYPTNETTQDVLYSPTHAAWERFADLMRFYAEYYKKQVLPNFLFKMALSFMEHQTLGVNRNAKIIAESRKEGGKGFPVVMLSHGLSANIHIYSLQAKEWASHGYVVFSADHEEEIYLNPNSFESFAAYMLVRGEQLDARKKTVAQVLDIVHDKNHVRKIFNDESVVLNYGKVFAAGHSFGGATVAELSVEDNRITGGVLLLDPWFEPCRDHLLYKKLDKPLFSLRSKTFMGVDQLIKPITKHLEANKSNISLTFSGYLKGSTHNSPTDLMLLMPRELVLFGILDGMNDITEQIVSQTLLTRLFLDTALQWHGDEEEKQVPEVPVRNIVLGKFQERIQELGMEDLLNVDDE